MHRYDPDNEIIDQIGHERDVLAHDLDRLRADLAEAREALRPFAELPDGLVGDPHPCIERCWRVGGPARIRDGACEECGLQDRRPDGEQQVVVRYGDVRRARDVLRKGGG